MRINTLIKKLVKIRDEEFDADIHTRVKLCDDVQELHDIDTVRFVYERGVVVIQQKMNRRIVK